MNTPIPPEVLEAMLRIDLVHPAVCEACGAIAKDEDGLALINGLWVCITCEDADNA